MNVSCPDCRSVFRVDPAKVPAGGVRARCSVCGGVMPVEAPAAAMSGWSPATAPPTPPGVAAVAAATPAMAGTVGATPWSATPVAAPSRPAPPPTPSPLPPPMASPMMSPMASPTPAAATPIATPATPPAMPPAAPAPSGPRPPINPFLSNDPGQKARRLARALVSDMVTYHPTLREQALRDGTIKQLFKEEIKKSYEEYIEQVGQHYAETTSHFQDALNDILAGGRQLF